MGSIPSNPTRNFRDRRRAVGRGARRHGRKRRVPLAPQVTLGAVRRLCLFSLGEREERHNLRGRVYWGIALPFQVFAYLNQGLRHLSNRVSG